MVSYLNPSIKKHREHSSLRRLSGKKQSVDISIPKPGINTTPLVRTPSYTGNTLRDAGATTTQPVPPATTPIAKKSWTQDKMIGNMNVGDFISIAGMLGYTVAPNTPMGRIGQVAAGYAQQEQERVAEAPGKALNMESKSLDIAQQKQNLKKTRAMTDLEQWRKNPKEYAAYKAAGREPGKPSEGFNMVDGKLMKGYWAEGGDFKPLREASPSEQKNWNDEDKKGVPKYHYQVDDTGKMSIYKDGKLIEGSGKGKVTDKPADKRKQRIEKYKVVNNQIKDWKESADGSLADKNKTAEQRKRFGAQYDAASEGWKIKYSGENLLYITDSGDIMDEFGKKIAEIEDDTTYYPIPGKK